MPNKCVVLNCQGNHHGYKTRIFRLPKDIHERDKWLQVIPKCEDFISKHGIARFFICEQHWPKDTQMKSVTGGFTRPTLPPSVFDVPKSTLPTAKPPPRKPQVEDVQLRYFLKQDSIDSFSTFLPEQGLKKKYGNIFTSRTDDKFVCVFMTKNYSESTASIIVHNKATLCSPLTAEGYKGGVKMNLSSLLGPNNGFSSFSQFFEVVNLVLNSDPSVENVIDKLVALLETVQVTDACKCKRLSFLTRQLHLLFHKDYSVSDYCFAVEAYPRCSYELLREYLVLPCKKKLQSIVSATQVEQVLTKLFQKVKNDQQKICFLLVDEVVIRPTVAYSGGFLSGMSRNDPDTKATAMLGVMLKCLHGGPSVMISITPVHRLTSSYQFDIVKKKCYFC